jgi:hypothetical protein
MDGLQKVLLSYKETTLKLIDCLKNTDYDGLDALFNKRGELIEEVKKLDYTQQEFIDACSSLNIMKLESDLNGMMKEKLQDTRNEIKKAASGRSINNAYNKSYSVEPIFFNKKI